MEELRARRRKRIAVCMAVLSISLMGVVTMARHHVWVSLACVGVEAVVVVIMLREVVAMQRQG
jgi:hypothetical protein